MDELNAKLRKFFDSYESANADFEVEKIASFYADVFMFGDPQGVRCVKKEDFVRVLPRRKEFFRSVGLVSSKIESLAAAELDSKYALARTVWKMQFDRGTSQPVNTENSASYILSPAGESFEIVFQIDHQDLTKRVQDLGLK